MVRKTTTGPGPKHGLTSAKPSREDRLKAALKSNMARRKAQARARTGPTENADAQTQGQETPDQFGKPDEQ